MIALWLACAAWARPTDGSGFHAFQDDDTVESFDGAEGRVRVWYSASGPNVVLPGDDDQDGVPDFVESVAARTEDVLAVFEGAGFRAPLPDAGEGGSDALDVYLVDFGGDADGLYAADSCDGAPRTCRGHVLVENDFVGYGYASVDTAVTVLVSHELFHAVQAAYDADVPLWVSEGTATWAEDLYDPGSRDFLRFCGAYLQDAGRSLDTPPAGPVPAFAYGTALWWWFLSDHYGTDAIAALLEASPVGDGALADLARIVEDAGGTLASDFASFARWNAATGLRAGAVEGYPFAGGLTPPPTAARGASIDDTNRYYPMAATYYALRHAGGALWFATGADAPDLAFSLHPLDADGRLLAPLDTFSGTAAPRPLGEPPPGDYLLVGVNPLPADASTRVRTCLGPETLASACASVSDVAAAPSPAEGCGCGTGATPVTAWGVGFGAAAWLRRRRERPV